MKLNVTWRVPFLDISTNESTLLISVQHSILMLRLGFSLISHYPLTQRITACHSGQASPHHTRTPYNIRGQILSWRTPESTPIWQLNKQLNDYYISIVWHLTWLSIRVWHMTGSWWPPLLTNLDAKAPVLCAHLWGRGWGHGLGDQVQVAVLITYSHSELQC